MVQFSVGTTGSTMGNLYVVVPAKGNSERLEKKNLLEISQGVSLVSLAIAKAKTVASKLGGRVIIDTDSEEIASIDRYLAQMRTGEFLSSNDASSIDLMVNNIKRNNMSDEDTLVHIYCTSPFLTLDTIFDCVCHVGGVYNSALTVTERRDLSWTANRAAKYNSQEPPNTQDIEPVYAETFGLNVVNVGAFGDDPRRGTHPAYLKVVRFPEYFDIDTLEDYQDAKRISELYSRNFS